MAMLGERRDFLKAAGVLSIAAYGGLGKSWLTPTANAVEPIQRTGTPKFKFSLAAYSFREFLTGKGKPAMTLNDFIDECAKMQLEGAEFTAYYFPPDAKPELFRKLKADCFRLGLDVSSACIGNDFCYPAGPKRDEQMAYTKKWIDQAELLDARVVRIFAGGVKPDQSEGDAIKLAAEAIEEACQYAGERGIFLAIENHGGLTSTPEGLLKILKAVKSPWFGVNLDTGNFHGADVYAELAQIAPYALTVQIKATIKPADAKKQPSDFKRLAKILGDVGYRGYLVLEYEEEEDPHTACPRIMDQIRAAFL